MGQKYETALDMGEIEAKVHYLCRQLIKLGEMTRDIYNQLDYISFSLDVARQDVRPRDIEEQPPTLRDHILWAERALCVTPYVMLACAGGTDEHWQIWDPNELHRAHGSECFPAFIVTRDGVLMPHPDGTYSGTEK